MDIRTTPRFDGDAAAGLLQRLVTQVDDAWPGTRPTLIQVDTRWPAYALAEDSRLRTAVVDAAKTVGVEVEARIAGPSNIGNYLAGLSIPATAGFGVTYVGLHGSDERIRLDTIPTVQAIYNAAVLNPARRRPRGRLASSDDRRSRPPQPTGHGTRATSRAGSATSGLLQKHSKDLAGVAASEATRSGALIRDRLAEQTPQNEA